MPADDRYANSSCENGFGDGMEKQIGRWHLVFCALVVTFLNLVPVGPSNAEMNWGLALYGGRLNDASLSDTVQISFCFEDAYFLDLALSRRLYTFRHYFNIEIEGQIAKHFGDQDHWEFNLVGSIRWLPFPWDAYLDTSFAAGVGLSYATSLPEIEDNNHAETAQFLGAVMLEFAFSLPKVPAWSLITRTGHTRQLCFAGLGLLRAFWRGVGMTLGVLSMLGERLRR